MVAYRRTCHLADEPAIAVVVQEMVESERSGVMFTVDPSTGDRSTIVIEGALGLGEVVVGGQVEPDTYRVDKDGPRIMDVRVGVQSFCIVADPNGGDRRIELSPEEGGRRVLGDDEVARPRPPRAPRRGALRPAAGHRMGDRRRRLFLVQSRPITTLGTPAGPAGGRAGERGRAGTRARRVTGSSRSGACVSSGRPPRCIAA